MKTEIIALFFLGTLFACGSKSPVEEAITTNKIDLNKSTKQTEKIQTIFYRIPSPTEIANLFYNANIEYHSEETNAIKNVKNYVTNTQKALNLGVYAADLSYSNVFDQSQQSMVYMDCTKKLADALDISAAFKVTTIERMEDNRENKDSLMIIINDVFGVINGYLNENGQGHLSALVMSGGWIEGLYLGTRLLNKENPNIELMQKIAAQKIALKSVMDLLTMYNNTEVVALKNSMMALQTAYAKVDEKEIDTPVIFEITAAVAQIRGEIIR